jgi:hypothetical protein
VVFDDSAGAYTVEVAEDVVPRQSAGVDGMTMTNNLNAYTFTGAGGIRGAASFAKYGTNSVELDNYSEIAVTVNEGSLTGFGTIGSVVVAPGSTLSWSGGGTVLGKVVSSGSLTNSGSFNGGLTLDAGTALNSGVINGPLLMETNTYLYNTFVGQLTAIGSPTVQTNATLVNDGLISGQDLNVSGTLYDSGVGAIHLSAGTLTINGGGTFIPGGAQIGTTTVKETSLSDPLNAGAVRFATGSTNIFKVDLGNSQPNTKVLANHVVFGPSQSTKAFNGGTLVITNIGAVPFAAGQSFKLFGSVSPPDGDISGLGLNTTNSYPVMVPAAPAFGLAWDLSNLIPGGYIGIKALPTTPTNLTFSSLTTTLTTTNSTNNVIIFDFAWPTNYVGWRLETQTTALTNGLSTNWTTLFDSVYTNQLVLTNSVGGPGAVFYRLSYP